jgi:GTP-binding protein YchF
MRLGIVGSSGAGKATIFSALTGITVDPAQHAENLIGTIRVPDPRVDALSALYRPRKTVYAQVEYLLPGMGGAGGEAKGESARWNRVRDCDALLHVVRNFQAYGTPPPTPWEEFESLQQELILSDLLSVEKRLERLDLDSRRGKAVAAEEVTLLRKCRRRLESEIPLRGDAELADAPVLRGFAFFSAKPVLVLFNNGDEDDRPPASGAICAEEPCLIIKGKLEQEIGQMAPEEAAEFLAEFNLTAAATDRVIQESYRLLGLISFFTVGEDEVRAWTLRRGTVALDAAGAVHSDMKKGFIRAEVLAYDDLTASGDYKQARKNGSVRLEGKTYPVCDGDIVTFRFNL